MSDWPRFSFSLDALEERLILFTQKAGQISGKVQALPDPIKIQTLIQLMVEEAVRTSEIEGEIVSRIDVLSSIQRNLNIHPELPIGKDKKAQGVGNLMTLVRDHFQEPLSDSTLFEWHQILLGGTTDLIVGAYRSDPEPMQVISGAMGRVTVHFEAPPSSCIPQEMNAFLNWFNSTNQNDAMGLKMAPIRAAVAHLYFESIHPFDDGNGRLGRAVSEKALSQGLGYPAILSLSEVIMANRNEYYTQLERAQKTLEISEWVIWFVDLILLAQLNAEKWIDFTIKKGHFFDQYESLLNDRQLKVVRRMFDAGPDGFTGGMNARKYIGITKTSKATATRDMQELLDFGVFIRNGESGGRSTSYRLNL
ncbi:MAG TPA: DUF4172 domain-containing protein [Bacteroidetes bacterium]|nr:DUF4172 domain-containing protein [Bacteroidota bacterium]